MDTTFRLFVNFKFVNTQSLASSRSIIFENLQFYSFVSVNKVGACRMKHSPLHFFSWDRGANEQMCSDGKRFPPPMDTRDTRCFISCRPSGDWEGDGGLMR